MHYVMAISFNPKDGGSTFATASLDRTIKVWSLNSTTCNYTLEGHEKGVNCLDYYCGSDKPYIVSGGDDGMVRVWDYQTKATVRVMDGHAENVSSTLFHPDLPLIISGSEDGTVKLWNSNNFRCETTFNFSLERVWSLAVRRGGIEIAVGCDEGSLVFSLGKGIPAVSMDFNGKLVWARHNQLLAGNIKQILEETIPSSLKDGDQITIPHKELGHAEMYPQLVQHSPSGRFVAICGDGEWIIYSALAWRNKAFGKGLELVWSSDAQNNDFCVRESPGKLSVFHNFAETGVIRLGVASERIFGNGPLISVACAVGQLNFFHWETCQIVRRIDVDAKSLFWSENGDRVAICTDECIFVLKYNSAAVERALNSSFWPEDGIEEAFEPLEEIEERNVISGKWIGDIFVFVSPSRISYAVGSSVYPISICDRSLYLVGYVDDRLILVDKDSNVFTYSLSRTVIDFEGAILHNDLSRAKSMINLLPSDQVNKVAQFLLEQGKADLAYSLASDDNLRFDLALQLGKLEAAFELASLIDSPHKWRQLGDIALTQWKTSLAEKCFLKSGDLPSLLLIYSSWGNIAGLVSLAVVAMEQEQYNIAFSAYFIAGRREECYELLIQTRRYPEVRNS